MRTLILLRHGEAERAAPSGRDIDRALTPQGRVDARAAGLALVRGDLRPNVALVSAALRTRQTWEAAAAALGGPAATEHAELYDAPADDLLAAAHACGAQTVAVVAHNPGVGELAARLSGEPARFPPASLAVFSFEGDAPRLVLRRDPAETSA